MNYNIEQGKIEFDKENYKEALKYLKQVGNDDEYYEYAQLYKLDCFMKLKCYKDGLEVVNSLISTYPYSEILWYEKVRCHILLNEDKKAYKALDELERVIDRENKNHLFDVVRLYSLLMDYVKVIEYCDMVLAIDENCISALYEKAIAASCLNDDDMVNEVSDVILNLSDGDLFSCMPVFLMKLFSKRYDDCLDIIENSNADDIKMEFSVPLKSVIYKHMSEDLNAKILVTEPVEVSVDDALRLMFEFKNYGSDHGVINGVQYFIL